MRKIENLPTQNDKPYPDDVKVVDCGQLAGADFRKALEKTPDATGDPYEDFPDDQGEDMTGQEYLKIATDLKDFGNKAFKSGDIDVGIEKYQKALRYLNEHPGNDDDPAELKTGLKQLRFTLHSNSALLANKAKRYADAEKWAGFGIDAIPADAKDSDKAKVYFRRGTARVALKDEEEALKDLEKAAEYAPGDAAINSEMTKIKKSVREKDQKMKSQYKKFFS